ncbi:MAG TPA: cytochrome C oxidase subunit IV family protein [Bryobacteraceae bacterium]|nr:cytochrome C oxidase subunit IV family protein [Bryobacteraceae bacterium]
MSSQTETTHDSAAVTQHAHTEVHEHGGTAIYTKTLIALLLLTGLTVLAASIDFGSGNTPIALAIATLKASLVVLFFMHLRWEKPVYSIIGMAGFIFLGIFLGFCLIDANSRVDFLPANLHQSTVMPLAPGTAPQSLTVLPPGSAVPGDAGAVAKKETEKK